MNHPRVPDNCTFFHQSKSGEWSFLFPGTKEVNGIALDWTMKIDDATHLGKKKLIAAMAIVSWQSNAVVFAKLAEQHEGDEYYEGMLNWMDQCEDHAIEWAQWAGDFLPNRPPTM